MHLGDAEFLVLPVHPDLPAPVAEVPFDLSADTRQGVSAQARPAAGVEVGSRFRMRFGWLVPALRLPGEVARDMVTVYAVWRRLVRGEQPPSAFLEIPVRFGDDSPEGATRRTLLIGGTSVAPNTFALGIDQDRDVMIVHRQRDVVPRSRSWH